MEHLGSLQEASGKPQGSEPLGSRSPWGALGSLWEPQVILWGAGNLRGASGKLLGSILGTPVVWGLWKALQLDKVGLCNGLHKIK